MNQNILFGSIEVRSGNKIHTVKRAVWIEGAEIYKPYKSPFKETAFIVKVIEFKIIGKTNTSKKFTEVKVIKEIRNKITGAYQ